MTKTGSSDGLCRALAAAALTVLVVAGALPILSDSVLAVSEYRYEVVLAPPTPLDYKSVSWSPDGSHALIVGGIQAVLRYEDREARAVADSNWSVPTQTLESVDVSSDGTAYISGGRLDESRVTGDVWTVVGSTISRVASVDGDLLNSLAVSPEGRVLAVGALGSLYELVDGTMAQIADVGDVQLQDVAWSPDGSGAFVVGGAGTVQWFDATNGRLTEVAITSTQALYSLSWRPGHGTAWAAGEGGLVLELNATTLSASRVRPATPRTPPIYGVSWHSNGEIALLVGEEGTTQLWRRGVFTTQLVDVSKDLLDVEWSPSEDEALVVGADGTVLRFAPRIPTQNQPPTAIISSPADGTSVEEGTGLLLDGSASSDPDDDPLTFTWVSDSTGLIGTDEVMKDVQLALGTHEITLHVDDGQGHNSTDTVTVTVTEPVPPEQRLHIRITSPPPAAILSGPVEVMGTADYELGEVAAVEVAVDNGGWWLAEGTLAWSYTLDTTIMENGPHMLRARATAEDGVHREESIFVEVSNELPPPPVVPNITLRMEDRGLVGEPVHFEAEGDGLEEWVLVWSFGDGAHAQGQGVFHAYREPGQYDVTLGFWYPNGTGPVAEFTAQVIIERASDRGPTLEMLIPLACGVAVLIYLAGYYGGSRALRRRRD